MVKIKRNLYFLILTIYLLSSFNLYLIYSHGIAKLLSFFLLIFNLVNYRNYGLNFKKEKKGFKKSLQLFNLFIIFFTVQSFSVINAENLEDYVLRYKDILFIGIFFINSLFYIFDLKSFEYKKIKNLFIFPLFLSNIYGIFVQILIYFFPNFFISFFSYYLHGDYLSIIKMNIERNRIYFESYEQILIPLIIYYIFVKKKLRKTNFFLSYSFFTGLLLIIITLSLLSNFRTKFLMLTFSLLFSFYVFRKFIKKKLFFYFFLFLIFIYFISKLSNLVSGINIFDRFYLINNIQEYSSINFRTSQIKDALDIFVKKPFFGIGVGNYRYYLNQNLKNLNILRNEYKNLFNDAYYSIHNIFFNILAENGALGLISFSAILVYFFYFDWLIFKRQEDLFKKSIIISFWTLFIYSLFNPTINSISYNILFWYLRLIILAVVEIKDSQQ